jgi:hypothetical protein
VKNLLELKEWAKEKDSVVDEIYQADKEDNKKEEKFKRKFRELQINTLYNLRYREEKESYKVNLNALRAYYGLGHPG